MDKKQIIIIGIMIVVSIFVLRHEAERAEAQRQVQAAKAQAQETGGTAQGRIGQAPIVSPATTLPQQGVAPAPAKAASAPATDLPIEAQVEKLPDIVVYTKNFTAVFSNKGAVLKRFTLNEPYVRDTKDENSALTLLDDISPTDTLQFPYKAPGEGLDELERAARQNFKIIAPKGFAIDDLSGLTGLSRHNFEVIARPQDTTDPTEPRVLSFRTAVNGWEITKTFTFASSNQIQAEESEEDKPVSPYDYGFEVKITIVNNQQEARNLDWTLTPLSGFIPDDQNKRYGMIKVLVGSNAENGKIDIDNNLSPTIDNPEPTFERAAGQVAWMGLKGRFFVALAQLKTENRLAMSLVSFLPLTPETAYMRGHPELIPFAKDNPQSAAILWRIVNPRPLQPGESQETELFFYGGPVEANHLSFEPDFEGVVTYSVKLFDPISRLFSRLLHYLYKMIPNYGICIILVTLIIKTSMHGLSRKAMSGQHKMQKLQPFIKEIKEKFKGDPAKQQQETMKLWREHGVSPWGSCLPMFVQIPILFALYGTFSSDFAIRQALFIPGWIEDLSQPDRLFPLGFTIPFMEWEHFNLLPILYVVMQLVQQSMTPKSTDPQQQQQQQMMKMMPLVFVFIFYTMPSGLVLYFTVSAGYTLVEHWFIRKQIDGKDNAVAEVIPTVAGQGFASTDSNKPGGNKKRKR